MLGAGTHLEDGKNLGAGIDGQPDPEHLGGAAQPGANFIQLQVREVQVAEGALMEELSVLACPSEPPRDGRLTLAEDAFSRGRVQPFGQRREDQSNLMGRGFQAIQGRVASSTEGGAARLTPKRLNPLGLAMLAIPDEGVELSVDVPEVGALPVGTGEAFGIYPFGGSPPAFDLAPRTQRRWPCRRRGSGGATTGGAIIWGARLQQTGERAALGRALREERLKAEPVKMPEPRQREEKTDHDQEQEQEHMKHHQNPRN